MARFPVTPRVWHRTTSLVDLALFWPRGLPFTFLERLRDLGIEPLELSPDDNAWVVNGLAIAPDRVILPRGMSDETRRALEERDVGIIEIDSDRVRLNGGGIHRSTSPLVRDPV